MSAQHTPGRLKTRKGFHDATIEIFRPDRSIKKPFFPTELAVVNAEDKAGKANARRLVACWNACDGISTDHLERHGLPDFTKKISDLREQHDDMQKQVAEIAQLGMVLREQRDELLAALVKLEAAFTDANITSREYRRNARLALLAARAAIAKVEGGAA